MASIAGEYTRLYSDQPPVQYVSRGGTTFTNSFQYPSSYNVNDLSHRLLAGANAYGITSATDANTGESTAENQTSESGWTGAP